jgi:hypothetical protein
VRWEPQSIDVMIVDMSLLSSKTQDVEGKMATERDQLQENKITIEVSLTELLEMSKTSLSTISSAINYHHTSEEEKKALTDMIKNYGYKSKILYRKLLEQYAPTNLELIKTIGNEKINDEVSE